MNLPTQTNIHYAPLLRKTANNLNDYLAHTVPLHVRIKQLKQRDNSLSTPTTSLHTTSLHDDLLDVFQHNHHIHTMFQGNILYLCPLPNDAINAVIQHVPQYTHFHTSKTFAHLYSMYAISSKQTSYRMHTQTGIIASIPNGQTNMKMVLILLLLSLIYELDPLNGHLIVHLPNTFHTLIVEFIYLLTTMFNEVQIHKTERNAMDDTKIIVCSGLHISDITRRELQVHLSMLLVNDSAIQLLETPVPQLFLNKLNDINYYYAQIQTNALLKIKK
jgi:hypothetical protein